MSRHSAQRVVVLSFAALLAGASASCGVDQPLDTFSWEAFVQPPVAARPWARWWWPGNDVKPEELTREVTLAAANGFGGLEVQAFDAALNPDDSAERKAARDSVDSDSFYANVRAALDAAKTANLRLDLTLGSGWNTGGPFIDVLDSQRTLLFSEYPLTGPGPATVQITAPGNDPFYAVTDLAAQIGEPMGNYLPQYAKRVAVMAARVLDDQRDPEVFVLTDTVTLDPASLVVLTDKVAADGTLAWDVPEGTWRVVAIWALPDGEDVSLHAYGAQSYLLDHFDAARTTAAIDHLLGDRTGLAGYFGGALRGVFADSFEFECERHWADDFAEQFKARRGYDLVPWMPVVLTPGADNQLFDGAGIQVAAPFALGADDERVRYDYQLTVSDLFIERFIRTATDWSEARGLSFRIQAYGIHADALKAAGTATIPEAEQLYAGGAELFLKAVSSGAHLYDRAIVGQESLVWSGRDWMTTPRKFRAAVDKSFAAGINGIVYHGFPYRTGEAVYGPTDWLPFSSTFGGGTYSTGIGEADPFWPWMPDLNRYVGRVQYAMRLGAPEADLLVYYPWLGIPASLMRLDDSDEPLYHGQFEDEADTGNNSLLGLIDGLFGGKSLQSATVWLGALRPALAGISNAGYAWDWVNDDRLTVAVAAGGTARINGHAYRGVLVPDVATMPPEAAEALARLAAAGVPVVFVGATPDHQPGYAGKDAGDGRVKAAVAAALGGAHVRKGAAITDAAALLADAGATPWLKHEAGTSVIQQQRRLMPSGARVVFLRNPGIEPLAASFVPADPCKAPQAADAWAGTARSLVPDASGNLRFALPSYGSVLLLCGLPTPVGQGVTVPAPIAVPGPSARVVPVDAWTLKVEGADVPNGSFQAADGALGDWRQRTELQGSASLGQYAATVDIGAVATGDRVLLDLGWLHGAARVRVNGQDAGDTLVPPYVLDVTATAKTGANVIDVTLTPPLRNRMLALGDADDPAAKEFKGKSKTRIAAGLVGPVVVKVGAP